MTFAVKSHRKRPMPVHPRFALFSHSFNNGAQCGGGRGHRLASEPLRWSRGGRGDSLLWWEPIFIPLRGDGLKWLETASEACLQGGHHAQMLSGGASMVRGIWHMTPSDSLRRSCCEEEGSGVE